MNMRRYAARDLVRVTGVEAFPSWEMPPTIGDRVCLNSGGPGGLVVDIYGYLLMVAYSCGSEQALPRACFHKYN